MSEMDMEMENSSSPKLTASTEASTVSSSGNQMTTTSTSSLPPPPAPGAAAKKKKRNQPGMPDPEAEVVALSPKALLATNRFLCEICGKGFQRDQNLQLHRRGHNLPWKLRQRGTKEPRKRVYVCPEPSCVHHDPRRALGDLTGIKKHFSRKHGEKKWKCERCAKKYAVQSDWKAHMKICGTKEYKCDCGTLFSRRDSFVTHRAFCDALTQETVKVQGSADDGTAAAAAVADAAVAVATSPVLHNQQQQNSELLLQQDTTMATAQPCPVITTTDIAPVITTTDIANNNNAPTTFTPISLLQQQQHHEAASQQVPPDHLPNMTRAASFPPTTTTSDTQSFTVSCPIDQPTSLSLSSLYQFSNPFFLIHHQHQHQRQHLHASSAAAASSPPPAAAMSATALLQKAAQMGAATASATSLLSSYGCLSTSTSQHENGTEGGGGGAAALCWPSGAFLDQDRPHVVTPDDNMLNGRRGGSSNSGVLFGSRPTTLDFLGLGVASSAAAAGGGSGSTPAAAVGGLSALLNSFTTSPNTDDDLLSFPSYQTSSSSWEGNDTKPNQTVQ